MKHDRTKKQLDFFVYPVRLFRFCLRRKMKCNKITNNCAQITAILLSFVCFFFHFLTYDCEYWEVWASLAIKKIIFYLIIIKKNISISIVSYKYSFAYLQERKRCKIETKSFHELISVKYLWLFYCFRTACALDMVQCAFMLYPKQLSNFQFLWRYFFEPIRRF